MKQIEIGRFKYSIEISQLIDSIVVFDKIGQIQGIYHGLKHENYLRPEYFLKKLTQEEIVKIEEFVCEQIYQFYLKFPKGEFIIV